MKRIVIFGAGKSSIYLIEYLSRYLQKSNWQLVVADKDFSAAQSKLAGISNSEARSIDVGSEQQRKELIASADLVISLLPPTLHYPIAVDCIAAKKHLLTASYIDDKVKALANDIEKNKLLFLCEMGLDPGIDHMSAMKLIAEIKSIGGTIHSFRSHCGGLVSPQSDDNPWHYKISWNPRNIVLAGKAGAHSKENGQINFVGNIEGRDVLEDKADVMVCEGFTGNIILKMAESLYEITHRKQIRHEYFDRFNFENYGGTPVLGVAKPVIIGHGVSKGKAFMNMIHVAENMVLKNVLGKMKDALAP